MEVGGLLCSALAAGPPSASSPTQVAAVLMTQMLPGLDPGPAKLLEEFDRAVYTAGFAR
jgi:hypothetical protein